MAVIGALFWARILLAAPNAQASEHFTDAPTTSIQQSPGADVAASWAAQGRVFFVLQFGYGFENSIPRDISHITMAMVEPQVGMIAWDSPQSRLPIKRFEVISGGILGTAYRPGGSLLGASVLFRLGLKPAGRVMPFVDVGSGPLRTSLNEHAREVTGHAQFLSQGGMGIQYLFHPRQALVFEYRYFHMSNGGLQEPNPGFNGSMVSVGFCWRRRPRSLAAARVPHELLHYFHLP